MSFRLFQFYEAGERKDDFRLVEDVKKYHIIAAMTQTPQRGDNRLRISQQVAKHHHQARMLEHGRQLPQAARDVQVVMLPLFQAIDYRYTGVYVLFKWNKQTGAAVRGYRGRARGRSASA